MKQHLSTNVQRVNASCKYIRSSLMGKFLVDYIRSGIDAFDYVRYFESILAACPDSVDEVIIEPDGEWHTEDNKYASTGWRSQQSEAAASSKANTPSEEKPRPSLQNGTSSNGNGYPEKETRSTDDARAGSSRMQEVVALDESDEDDEPLLKHIARPSIRRIPSATTNESSSADRLVDDAMYPQSGNATRPSEGLTGSVPPPTAATAAGVAEPVIDLTLTDDEEELAGPVLPAWAADIPALAKADKRERSMSSMLEAEDRNALRRRLASNGAGDNNGKSASLPGGGQLANFLCFSAYEPSFRSTATSPLPATSESTAAGPAVPALPPVAVSDQGSSAPSGLKVRLTLPPRPRIDPLPPWMNAEPSRSGVNGQSRTTDDATSWLNAPASRTDSTGTNTPISTVRDI